MTIKFNDIMQKFYDDETLGIKNEDAPTNNASSGAVAMPPDAAIKKKKKNLYDGRRKEAKAFFKRIEQLRAKRDKTFREKVKENIESFGEEYLLEANVDILRKIVKNKQNMPVKMKDGRMKVDLFTASEANKRVSGAIFLNALIMSFALNKKIPAFQRQLPVEIICAARSRVGFS